MDIELKEITIRELVAGYKDDQENGCVGYGGKLNIRPPYQREFVYKDQQRDAVIATVNKGFPLNVMYWAENEGDQYEIIDGQQRTVSICQYANGDFSFKNRAFFNLESDEKEKFLNYKIMVYFCTGKPSEKLDWFKIINIAGEKLTEQELRNAVWHGKFITDAKKRFSKRGCAAYNIGNKYLKGSSIRQEYLETVIKWKSGNVAEYMAKNQHQENANELWEYFQNVIKWIKTTFQDYRREMKGLEWGELYNEFKDEKLNAEKISKEVNDLMEDEEVQKKTGIYFYVLTRKEKYLNLRTFSQKQKRETYEKQKGICPLCKGNNKTKKWQLEHMEADHIIPWSKGGKTENQNCQVLCKKCNREKSNQ